MSGQRLTDKTALTEQTGSGDLFMVVDVSDSTGSASGTSKKIDSKYVIQTDKISLNNTEVQALSTSAKTLVGALSGYMVTPINITALITYAASTETSNANLYFGYTDSSTTFYWDTSDRFMTAQTTDNTYVFGGNMNQRYPVKSSSIENTPFIMWSSSAFNGGFTMDIYITYAYTKIV